MSFFACWIITEGQIFHDSVCIYVHVVIWSKSMNQVLRYCCIQNIYSWLTHKKVCKSFSDNIFSVHFRYVVFRPFVDEILLGKIKSCSKEGVHGKLILVLSVYTEYWMGLPVWSMLHCFFNDKVIPLYSFVDAKIMEPMIRAKLFITILRFNIPVW